MSEQPAKIRIWWLLIVAVLALALGFLVRGCGKKSDPVQVFKWLPVNIDSLKATIPRDTVEVPGKQVTRIVRVPVLLSDTALVDSLMREYTEQRDYFQSLLATLQGDDKDFGWNWSESVVLETKESVYADSITTPDYFHEWYISAEGPIKTYSYRVIPLCPVPAILKPAKSHRIGAFAGLQTNAGTWRQVYGVTYRYNWAQVNAGYLPKAGNLSAGLQFTVGADIGVK